MDTTIRVWNLASGKCLGVLSAIGGAGGHTDAVSCLEFIPSSPSIPGSEAFVASGGAEGAVKIWKTSGTLAHSCSHTSVVTALRAFKDSNGGNQVLLIGLLDGSIVIRSCLSMKMLFTLDQSICHTKAIWTIVDLGQSCFATGSDEGAIIVWKIPGALVDK